ncbi:MAG TPA: M48 family metallopeptidase [Candidatus Angelobacter sp.]|jgi:predicted Zn-dependent protease|nr:M48 family metallopeptidase [Candidatus Angelobacter sp.]
MIPPSLRASRIRTLSLRLPAFTMTIALILLAGPHWALAQTTSRMAGTPGPCSRQSTAELPKLADFDDHRDVLPPAQVTQPVAIASKGKKVNQKYDVSAIGARKVDRGFNFYSFDREREMGKAMAQELEGQVRMLADPMVNEYISKLAQRLIRHSDAKVPFVVKVVDSDEVNAFALPGGFFYVNTGLILTAQNEAELAGVLAHEIAHVAARHATRNMTKVQVWNLASIPLMFVAGPAGFAIRQVSSVAFPMSTLKFSRDAEREADLLGLEYEYAAGYDPEAFISFFERLGSKREKKNFLAKAFSSHPMNADRIHRAEQEITTMLPEKADYVVDTSEFEDVRAHLFHLMNAKPILGAGTDGPVLRRRTEGSDQSTTPDDRPRLERR